MSSIRILSLVGGVVLALSSVACVAAAPSEQDQKSAGSGFSMPKKGTATNGGGSQATTAGTCDGVCAHYLECMGIEDTAETRGACVNKCKSMNASASDLAQVEQADCATIIDASSSSSSSSSSGGSGSTTTTKGKECDDCVSDGSGGCYWGSQGNWGSSGYSGAVAECNAYCCE